jgi:hypothetical protein
MTETKSTALVRAEMPGRYMRQMCSHFAHKLPTTSEGDSGRIEFPSGMCQIEATTDTLLLTVEAENAEDLTELQDVIARHLVRFAWREELQIEWVQGTSVVRA